MFVSLTIILSLTPLSNVCIPPLQYLLSSQLHLTCYKFIIMAWHWLQLLMVPSRSCIHWSLLINYYCMCVSHPSLLNPAFLGQSILISPTHPLLHVHPTPLVQSLYLISPYSSPATSCTPWSVHINIYHSSCTKFYTPWSVLTTISHPCSAKSHTPCLVHFTISHPSPATCMSCIPRAVHFTIFHPSPAMSCTLGQPLLLYPTPPLLFIYF